MADANEWNVNISGGPPCTEGEQRCFGNDLYECQNGEWVLIEANSSQCQVDNCGQYQDETSCENNGCYWYSYPFPWSEPSCHKEPWYLGYMPHIIVSSVAIGFASLIVGRRPPRAYYPPPPSQRGTKK